METAALDQQPVESKQEKPDFDNTFRQNLFLFAKDLSIFLKESHAFLVQVKDFCKWWPALRSTA